MPAQTGRLNAVGVGKEAPRGTAKAAVDAWIEHSGFEATDMPETVYDEDTMGRIEDTPYGSNIEIYSEPNIEGNARAKTMGYFLLGVLGTVTSNDKNTAKQHIFTVLNDELHPTFTITKVDGVKAYRYPNCVIDELDISMETGSIATFSASYMGRKGVPIANAPNVAYTTENPRFEPQNIEVKVADTIAGLAAAPKIQAKSASIKITKELEKVLRLGDDTPSDYLVKQISVEGELELYFDSEQLKGLLDASSTTAVQIKLSTLRDALKAGVYPDMTITLHQAFVFDFEPTYAPGDLNMVTVSLKAVYGMVNNEVGMITVELNNKQAAY